MDEQKIEFRKVREFGENLSDTFLFIKQNLKPLLISVFGICGVFMLAKAILGGVYESQSFGIFDRMRSGLASGEIRSFGNILTPEYLLFLLFSWMSYIAIRVTLAAYVKCYVTDGGLQPTLVAVWQVFKRYYIRLFIYSIPLAVLMFIGFIFCIIPGFYLLVVLMPFELIVVMEDLSFGDAFNRCFILVKDNFWISLAIYLIASLVYWFASAIVTIAVGVVIGLSTYFTTRSVGTTAGAITSFVNVFNGAFYIIFFVSMALQYFNLVEIHDGTGVLGRLDTIGSEQRLPDHTGEEF